MLITVEYVWLKELEAYTAQVLIRHYHGSEEKAKCKSTRDFLIPEKKAKAGVPKPAGPALRAGPTHGPTTPAEKHVLGTPQATLQLSGDLLTLWNSSGDKSPATKAGDA